LLRTLRRAARFALLAGCARGPDPDVLVNDVQARLDAVFGQPLVEVGGTHRRRAARPTARPTMGRGRSSSTSTPCCASWPPMTLGLGIVEPGADRRRARAATDQGIFGLAPGRQSRALNSAATARSSYRKTDRRLRSRPGETVLRAEAGSRRGPGWRRPDSRTSSARRLARTSHAVVRGRAPRTGRSSLRKSTARCATSDLRLATRA